MLLNENAHANALIFSLSRVIPILTTRCVSLASASPLKISLISWGLISVTDYLLIYPLRYLNSRIFIAITPNLHLLHEIHDFASAYFGKSLQRRRKPTTELALSLNSSHCKLKWRQKWIHFFKLWKKIICKSLQKWWLTLRDLWFPQILVISRTMYRRLTDLRNSHTSSHKSVQNWINVFSIFAFLNRIILQIHK